MTPTRILFFIVFLATSGFSQKNAPANPEIPLRLEWQLLTNNHQQKREILSAFLLTNTGKKAFAAAGWAIYFNYNRPIFKEKITGNVVITHVNGDLYRLSPAPGFKALNPGESAQITYVSEGELRNYSSAPNGFYLVWDASPEKGITIRDLHLAPIRDTTVAWVTPETVYRRNQGVQDIPDERVVKVLPTPAVYVEKEGAFELTGAALLSVDPAFEKEAAFLSDAIATVIGVKLKRDLGANGKKIIFQKSRMAEEAYRLTVSNDHIFITAASPAGAFYAVQSLLCLLPPACWSRVQASVSIPAVEIQDTPRFGYRSLSLDVARNFRDKREVLKVLDLMAMYKLNVLHFHLTEDEGWRIEILSMPELTETGARRGHSADGKNMLPPAYGSGPEAGQPAGSGFYSRSEFIEILKYATARHIEVIPEIESPGHGRAAIKAMDARYEKWMKAGNVAEAEKYLLRDVNDRSVYSSAQLWTDNVMCVALPSVYTFMETVTDELIAMYREAQAPLKTIHMGGDEVPAGVWERSPLCQNLIASDPSLDDANDLWYYYYGKLNDMLQRKNLFMSGWEEMAMRKTKIDGRTVMIPNPGFAGKNMQVHVWNNVIGWGAEDLPYRLANAGFKVVLSPVSNNYFDLSYYKHPDEPCQYWGGHQDIDKPFYFAPFDYYKMSREDADGNRVDPAVFVGKDRLTDYGKSNIAGLEGLIWSEQMLTDASMEYMLLPKMLGFAERAWAPDPSWAIEKDTALSRRLYEDAWAVFVNTVGKRALPRLDYAFSGFSYRLPPPGAVLENGKVLLNVQFPGLTIRYTTDGTTPTNKSNIYTAPIPEKGRIKAGTFDSRGRASRIIEIYNP